MIKLTTPLFEYIDYDFSELGISNTALDFYFVSKYSNRYCSPILELIITDGSISEEDFTVLGQYINQLYRHKWNRLSALLELEYDPIHNYLDDMTENIEDNDDKTTSSESDTTKINTRTDNLTRNDNLTRTEDLTRTDNLTRTDDLETEYDVAQTLDSDTSKSNENSLYGFNSDDPVPSDASEGNGTRTDVTSQDGTVSNSGTVKNTGTVSNSGTVKNTGTQTNTGTVSNNGTENTDTSETSERDYTRERTVMHKGNIGNLTPQDMLTQEVEFWQWNFIIQVLADVSDILTLPTY